MGCTVYISYQPQAKYVNHLVSDLKSKNLVPILPIEIIKIESREININAFEQLKKRNPRNPFLMKMKRIILENEIERLKKADILLIFNPLGLKSGYVSSQQLISLTVAWQNKIQAYLMETPDPSWEHYEEIMAMNPMILKGDISKIITKKDSVQQLRDSWLKNNTTIDIETNSIRPKLKLRIQESNN